MKILLKFVKKKLNVLNCNMVKIDLPNEKVDNIICIATFHHLSCIENRIEALKK